MDKESKKKISRKMFAKELRSMYFPGKMISSLLRKKWGVKLFQVMIDKPSRGKSIKGIVCSEMMIIGQNNGPDIRIRVFKPEKVNGLLPGMLFIHGGGYIVGTPEQFLETIKSYIHKRPCIVIAPDYRKALKSPYPDGFNDCYDTLLWMKNNGHSVGLDHENLIIAGHSAGAGLTAALSLKARDSKAVDIKFQIPVYPMLDDRLQTASVKALKGVPMWDSENTAFAWNLYLKRLRENGEEIPVYASPARAKDFSNLPPTITFIGDSEPFRDETLEYLNHLDKNGVPIKYSIFKGAYHGFEIANPKATISKQAVDFLLSAYAAYYDEYLTTQ